MRYRILGTTTAADDHGTAVPLGGPRLRALLTALALHPSRITTPRTLIDEVWADDPPQDAPAALQALIGRLRRALGKDAVTTSESGGYRLTATQDDIDLFVFERLVQQGADALASDDPALAERHLDDALALWRGPALADLTRPLRGHPPGGHVPGGDPGPGRGPPTARPRTGRRTGTSGTDRRTPVRRAPARAPHPRPARHRPRSRRPRRVRVRPPSPRRGPRYRPGPSVARTARRTAVTEICRRLDGLPLAIELAAARLRLLTPRQIADRLDDRFCLLTSGSRTVLPRR